MASGNRVGRRPGEARCTRGWQHIPKRQEGGRMQDHVWAGGPKCMALAPLPHWTFLTRHNFKDKIMKNFKMLINSRALNQTWCPSECSALGPALASGPWSQLWLCVSATWERDRPTGSSVRNFRTQVRHTCGSWAKEKPRRPTNPPYSERNLSSFTESIHGALQIWQKLLQQQQKYSLFMELLSSRICKSHICTVPLFPLLYFIKIHLWRTSLWSSG